MVDAVWKDLALQIPLAAEQIHVWLVDYRRTETHLKFLASSLSVNERQRAEQFRHAEHANRYIAAHAVTRQLLAFYLQTKPAMLAFHKSPNGKPSLHEPISDIQFSISYAGNLCLIAFARGFQIGVDIEKIDEHFDLEMVAHDCFSGDEFLIYQNLSGAEKTSAFFKTWTRKEALLKACGVGLSLPMNRLEVLMPPGDNSRLRYADCKHSPVSWDSFSLMDLAGIPGYAAALAASGKEFAAQLLVWTHNLAYP